ncbi:MAG: efflux RND transporter permease subunit [Gammaproteobacteria bacterium]|jgi:predicted RND superfamily exporter protein
MIFIYKIAALVSRHTGLTLGVILALAVLALTAIVDPLTGNMRLHIDPSANRLFSENMPAKQFYDKTRQLFGSDETLIITLASDDIFTPENVATIQRITDRITEIDAVRNVLSLSSAVDIRSVDEGLDISPFFTDFEEGTASLDDTRTRIMGNPLYAGNLVSVAGDVTALVVYFNDISDSEYIQGGIHDRISTIVDEEHGDTEVFMTGSPYFKYAMVELLVDDLIWTPPLITIILVIVLAISFRTLLGVIVPLLTVAIGVIMTLGTIAALGYSLSMISVLVPPLLMILGFSYSVHVTSEYHQQRQKPDSYDTIILQTLKHMTLPVILTGLTTIAGFIALMANPITAVREFGVFSAIGVVFITLLSITFTPALLKALDRNPEAWTAATPAPYGMGFDRFIDRIALFDLNHQGKIFIAFGILFLFALAGMTRIHVSTESITNFDSESDVRKGFDVVNEQLGGANHFYIVIEGTHPDAFKEPENLKIVRELQDWLEQQPEVGGTLSIADYLMLVNQAFNDNDPASRVIPESRRLITQLLFLSSSDELDRIVDSRYKTTNIVVRSRVINSDRMSALLERINPRLQQLPEHLQPAVTGNPVLISETLTDIIVGQARSVGLALVFVYAILTIMFMSQRIGFVALIPNIIPVAVYFGSLGFFGISLNPSTSLIAPMVLGIAIDDTIHYFSRFNREVHRHADDRKATLLAMKAVGRPVTFTSIGLCLGFLVLMTSDLRMQAHVGIMASYALAIAWLSDFFLTPALCSSIRFTTLWDALTLDLGENPQKSIPLLKGLKTSQARIVALMAKIIRVPKGQRLINDGDAANEMYVVIEGKLKTSIKGDEGRIELATHERGDVVGEAGLFFETRTADVDVDEDSRLLCLSQENLDRLSRRYPYIATKVFRNLNRILATRLFTTTHRLT